MDKKFNRRSIFTKPDIIEVQGVLGTFKVPGADLRVEYILTYVPLDGQTVNGKLLNLLVPVREVFDQQDLDFDHLLQRDLDDFRVSREMVPYLLGKTSSDPRFFPPIVAVIVPKDGKKIKELYPKCREEIEKDGDFKLKVFKYGDVFSVKREKQGEQLAQSPVDLCIHPANAKLVIVDGQHRAMAMLATYRNAQNEWGGIEFQYFYQTDEEIESLDLSQIHLPVCIAYFPELTEDSQTTTTRNLTIACRKFFLDVNRNAHQPSKARQILLNDTDLVACFTRHLFNMVQSNTKTGPLQLHHTEYDNPQDQIPISRPFALTDVYTLYNVIHSVLLMTGKRVDTMTISPSGGKLPQENERLQQELDLENVLTEEDKDDLRIEIPKIQRDEYPKLAEKILCQCFEKIWGQTIVSSLSKFFPFSTHIKAVDHVLEKHRPYMGVNEIAHTCLVEGQGLRHTLERQQQSDKKERRQHRQKGGEDSDLEKAWEALREIEMDFEEHRARLYLQRSPKADDIKMVNRIFDCFRSSAFQNGLFMGFAYMKSKIEITDPQEFASMVDKWIKRINKKFQDTNGVKEVLFDYENHKSLRSIYKSSGGLTPSDWPFFRYLILELLGVRGGKDLRIIKEAQKVGRPKLYERLYNRKQKELSSEENGGSGSQINLESMSLREITDAFKSSLDIDKKEIERDVQGVGTGTPQSALEGDEEDETDETDDLPEEQ